MAGINRSVDQEPGRLAIGRPDSVLLFEVVVGVCHCGKREPRSDHEGRHVNVVTRSR